MYLKCCVGTYRRLIDFVAALASASVGRPCSTIARTPCSKGLVTVFLLLLCSFTFLVQSQLNQNASLANWSSDSGCVGDSLTFFFESGQNHDHKRSSKVTLLSTLDGWIDEIPPQQQPMRFGNKAFSPLRSSLNQAKRGGKKQ